MTTLPVTSFKKGKRKPTTTADDNDTSTPTEPETATPAHKRARTSHPFISQQSEIFCCCHYRTLMIESDAEVVDIKKAHRKMAVKYHPDKNTDASAQNMFVHIQEAYETLSDPLKRRAYDTKMRHHIHHHHSTPLSQTFEQPACDMFGTKQPLARRSRLARYIFASRNSTSSPLAPTSSLSSTLFAILCAALFVCVVIPSFILRLVSGVILSLSTTYRLLRSSQTTVPA